MALSELGEYQPWRQSSHYLKLERGSSSSAFTLSHLVVFGGDLSGGGLKYLGEKAVL